MRILIVHECFPPDYRGGGEYVVLRVAQHLLARGHEVRVLTTGDPAVTSWEGVPTQRLAMPRPRLALARAQVEAAARWSDVVYACTYFALWPSWRAARRLGKPVVFSILALFDDAWLDMKGPLRGRAYRAVERWWLRLPAAARIFLSPPSMAAAARLGLAQAGDVVVAPGIELQHFQPAAHKEGVAFAGKLDVRKGVDLVMQAARRFPHVPFTMVGWGERYEDLRQRAPPNLSVLPFEGHAQLGAVLGHSRIFLFPTLAETFGLAVVEAMAAGCAVVSSAPVQFEGERVDPTDAEGVFQALQRLLEDEERCRACGKANHHAAQAFDWQRHAAALEAEFTAALARATRT